MSQFDDDSQGSWNELISDDLLYMPLWRSWKESTFLYGQWSQNESICTNFLNSSEWSWNESMCTNSLCLYSAQKLFKLTPFQTPALDYIVFSLSMGDSLQINSVKSPG